MITIGKGHRSSLTKKFSLYANVKPITENIEYSSAEYEILDGALN